MRNLTEDELKLAPDWATHYIVDSDGSIIYESEKLCWWVGRREPLDNEGSFGNSSNRAINTFNITQHEVANHITVLENGELGVFGSGWIIDKVRAVAIAKALGVTGEDLK
ncbi:hypothetical protein [Pseudoalteromonas phage PHS3]|nr:hypothetical protein [Pseudoalteromonas phage PHS3]